MEIPIQLKAEYDHSPVEHTNIAVSDTNAESNATEKRDTIDHQDEGKPIEVAATMEEPEVNGSKESPVDSGEQHEQTPPAHDVVDASAKNMPTESESHPSDVPEIAVLETVETKEAAQVRSQLPGALPQGNEPDNFQLDVPSDVPPGLEDPVSKEAKDVSHELENMSYGNISAAIAEPAARNAEGIVSELEKVPSEDVQSTPAEPHVAQTETLPSESENTVKDIAPVEENHGEKNIEESDHVPDDQHVAETSDPEETIRKERSSDSPKEEEMETVLKLQSKCRRQQLWKNRCPGAARTMNTLSL